MVSIPHNDPAVPTPFQFTVTGTVGAAADPPHIVVSNGANPPFSHGSTLAWGTVPPGTGWEAKTIKVLNGASAPASDLIAGPATVTNTIGAAFSMGGALVTPLGPGHADNFSVRMNDTQPGTYQALVSIPHNDPAVPTPFQFTVTGTVGSAQP